ncbi:recombinase family protein [Peribacillus frigoritolerans]|uniref:recombinase family protein n=1 Tax=Peribacillus frigoritolerans TaxID=450367 RepID=UPI0025A282DB|nr:recombinase family protein [Peribacillus frigoritolerans]MDM5306374.1 recombinase family protein [Peribacillus frigoritolerans]
MKTAIYARKSTNKLGQKETIENQIKICRRYAADHGLEVVDVKTDSGTGTDDINRKEVKELITDALAGKYDCVIMKGISRLYRDTEKGLGLIKKLDRSNIRVITVEEMFDSQENRTGAGKLDTSKITMYLMFSEMESKKLGERIKHTQIEKAYAGEWNQASSVPFGYEYDNQIKKLKIDYKVSSIIEMIFKLYLEGKGTKSIAFYLNGDNEENKSYPSPKGKRWSEYTIAFILKNQVYIGNVIYNKRSKTERPYKQPELIGKTEEDVYVGNDLNDKEEWIIVENAHPGIIKKGIFKRAQEILNTKSKRKGIRNNVSLFASIAKCAICGSGMTFKRGRKNDKGHIVTKDNYYCMNYIRYGKQFCTSHHVGAKELEAAVLDDLIIYLDHDQIIDDTISKDKHKLKEEVSFEKDLSNIENEISKITIVMDTLFRKYTEGLVDENQLHTMNKMYSDQLNNLTNMMKTIRESKKLNIKPQILFEKYKKEIEQIKFLKFKQKEEKRYDILELIDEIKVDGDTKEIEIRYNFKNPAR